MSSIKEMFKNIFPSSKKNLNVEDNLPKMPDKDKLNEEFDLFLEKISMPQQTIEKMKIMSDENKWLMICQNKRKTNTESSDDWVHLLKNSATEALLIKFKVVITGADVKWMQKFVDNKGLFYLTTKNLHKNQKNEEVEIACLRAIRAFMNSDFGLKAVIKSPEIFDSFIYPLRSDNEEILMLVFDLFTVTSWISVEGNGIVVDVMSHNREETKSKTMYNPVLKAIKNKDFGLNLKISAMTLINSLINSIHNLEERNHERSFLVDEGISDIIAMDFRKNILSSSDEEDNDLFLNQISIFEREWENDKKESELLNVNLSDPDSVWNLLRTNALDSGQSAYLMDLMKYLLIIPNIRRISDFIWLNCTYAMKFATMFIINDKEISEMETNFDKIDKDVDINEVIKKSFTSGSRLLKNTEIDRLMSKAVTHNKDNQNSNDQLESMRKEFHDYKMKKEQELDDIKKKLSERPVVTAAAEAPTPAAGTPLPPPMGGDSPLPPPMGGDSPLPPPMGGDSPLPPPMGGDSPLPPPMGGGIGAPPPLSLGGIGAPPPFGSKAAVKAYLPDKPNKPPGVKMKNLHWGKIPINKIEGTVWDQIKDDTIQLNIKEFEDTFKAKAAPTKKQGLTDSKPKKVIKERVALVDSKRSTNVEIALSRFKMTPEAIRDAILEMNEKILTADTIQKLLSLVPTNEEAEMCASYDGNIADLGNTEKFFRVVSAIPNITNRLSAFLFKQQFDEMYGDIMKDIDLVKKSAEQIRTNEKMKKVLAIILKIGNHMNGGSKKGGAYGYKLSTLKQLNSTKSTDNKITLLQYMVKYIQEKYPGVDSFVDDFNMLKDAVRVESQNLQGKVNKMKANINKIGGLIKKAPTEGKDRFKSVMESFFNAAAEKAAKMHVDITNVTKTTEDLAEKFNEDKSKMKWEELFKIFYEFVESFKNGILYWKRAKEREEKEKKKAAFAIENKNRMNKIKKKNSIKTGTGENVLNNLKNPNSNKLAEEIARRRKMNK